MNRTILLMALAACGGAAEPQFLVSETPACEHDVRDYDRGLFAYLAADTDGDGAFELSFDEGLVRSVSGSYNLATGAFGYNETFEKGHYRVSREVYGQGVVWTDGDIDLSYQVIDTFTNEGQLGNVVRERRIGCDVERYYSDFEDNVVLVESGVVGAERYSYVRRQYDDGRVLETTGTLSPEGEWNEELAYTLDEVLYVHEERGRANGVVTRSFSHTDVTWPCRKTGSRWIGRTASTWMETGQAPRRPTMDLRIRNATSRFQTSVAVQIAPRSAHVDGAAGPMNLHVDP